ncbi:hypothetical protein JCM9743_16590 [Natrinema sp. JCM 9743]
MSRIHWHNGSRRLQWRVRSQSLYPSLQGCPNYLASNVTRVRRLDGDDYWIGLPTRSLDRRDLPMSGRDNASVDVLLVEDEAEAVRLIGEAFDEVDAETSVRVAADGDEALTVLTERGDEPPSVPDLVLLDLDVPRLSGLELLEAITNEPTLARLPVLVLTQSAAVEDVRASYELAANASLTKPSEPEAYAEMIEAIVDFWFGRAALPTNGS